MHYQMVLPFSNQITFLPSESVPNLIFLTVCQLPVQLAAGHPLLVFLSIFPSIWSWLLWCCQACMCYKSVVDHVSCGQVLWSMRPPGSCTPQLGSSREKAVGVTESELG